MEYTVRHDLQGNVATVTIRHAGGHSTEIMEDRITVHPVNSPYNGAKLGVFPGDYGQVTIALPRQAPPSMETPKK